MPDAPLAPMTWSVSVSPPVGGDTHWRNRLVERLRPQLAQALDRDPDARKLDIGGSLLHIQLERLSGKWQRGTHLRFTFLDTPHHSIPGSRGETPAGLVTTLLPEHRLGHLQQRLVGLEHIQDTVRVQLECRWDGRATAWSERTGSPVSPVLVDTWTESVPLFIFAGDPGVGKSALAQVAADAYCRDHNYDGSLLWLGTDARGTGLVGDFSNRIRAAFAELKRRATAGPAFLIIDEADALAMRRSEAHAHQEDRAATATVLQMLDQLHDVRAAVFFTTNLLDTVDPAVLRRGTSFTLERPDHAARQKLLSRWFPQVNNRTVNRAATLADGMTPADIERAITTAYTHAIRSEAALSMRTVLDALKTGERTRGV